MAKFIDASGVVALWKKVKELFRGAVLLKQTQISLPESTGWGAVTYGNGRFVAIAYANNKAAYSTDGINWTETKLPLSANWISVTYGNGKFVAIAGNGDDVAYSADGINWTASLLPMRGGCSSVAYGRDRFIAVANSSEKAAYSLDGINWTALTALPPSNWRSVTYGNGKFVMLSSETAAYSPDGIGWTETTLPTNVGWQCVTYGNGKFVAITGNGDKAAYSLDGINWTAATLPSSAYWYSATYGNGRFMAVALNSDKAAYSTDGINWTASTLPLSANWQSVTYGSGKFVAIAYSNNRISYSMDGVAWSDSATSYIDSAGNELTGFDPGPLSAADVGADPAGSAGAVDAKLTRHAGDKSNPHGVTAAQVGARPDTWTPAWGEVTGKPTEFPPSGGPYLPLSGGTMTGDVELFNSSLKYVSKIVGSPDSALEIDGSGFCITFKGYGISIDGERVRDVAAPTAPTDAATKGYVDSHLPQYVKLITEGDDGKASYVLPAGNQTLEVNESVLVPFRFLKSVWSSEGQYQCTIETFLHEGRYKVYLCRGSNTNEPIGDATVNAKGNTWIYFYEILTPDTLMCLEVRRLE